MFKKIAHSRKWTSLAFVLAVGMIGLQSGCSEDGNSAFMEVEPTQITVADFNDFLLEGGDVLVFRTTINGDMIHPEIRSTWTNLNREIFIDFYVVRAEDYDPDVPPNELPKIFWSSVPEEGPLFGDRRPTSIIVHPCEYNDQDQCRPEGGWVLLFHNPELRTPATRSRLSATVFLRYFE